MFDWWTFAKMVCSIVLIMSAIIVALGNIFIYIGSKRKKMDKPIIALRRDLTAYEAKLLSEIQFPTCFIDLLEKLGRQTFQDMICNGFIVIQQTKNTDGELIGSFDLSDIARQEINRHLCPVFESVSEFKIEGI